MWGCVYAQRIKEQEWQPTLISKGSETPQISPISVLEILRVCFGRFFGVYICLGNSFPKILNPFRMCPTHARLCLFVHDHASAAVGSAGAAALRAASGNLWSMQARASSGRCRIALSSRICQSLIPQNCLARSLQDLAKWLCDYKMISCTCPLQLRLRWHMRTLQYDARARNITVDVLLFLV